MTTLENFQNRLSEIDRDLSITKKNIELFQNALNEHGNKFQVLTGAYTEVSNWIEKLISANTTTPEPVAPVASHNHDDCEGCDTLKEDASPTE